MKTCDLCQKGDLPDNPVREAQLGICASSANRSVLTILDLHASCMESIGNAIDGVLLEKFRLRLRR